jgi:hypothetical protein
LERGSKVSLSFLLQPPKFKQTLLLTIYRLKYWESSLIFFLLLIGIFTSCSVKKIEEKINDAVIETAFLEPGDSAILPIDERTSLHNPTIQYYEVNGKEYLVISDRITSRLLFFDFNTKELSFEVKFSAEGENGIGEFRGATVLSMDSIIVLGKAYDRFYLSDTTGRLIRKYILEPHTQSEPIQWLQYSITSCFKPSYDGIFAFTLPFGLGHTRESEALKEPCITHYDLKKETWNYIDMKFPPIYSEMGGHYTFTHFLGDIEVVDNKLIVNFPASNYLYVYEKGQVKEFEARVRGTSTIYPPSDDLPTTSKEIDTYILQSPTYLFLLYDKYRKVYYRFFLDKQEDNSSNGDILKMYDEKPCSIVILDSAFTKIGETSLPLKTYHIPDHFVSPKGLYISTNHPDNPSIKEDQLSYRLFTLQKKVN